MGKALLAIDLQNDFYEEGKLPVADAGKINPVVNQLLSSSQYDVIVASQDWHPAQHQSYAVNMGRAAYTPFDNGKGIGPVLWPVHCKQGTKGAEFHPEIATEYFDYIIRKGTNPEVDSYSAFRENNGTTTGLAGLLKALTITEVDLCGLALDYCVKYSALDAVKAGFKTKIILNATRGVASKPDDIDQTLQELTAAGVKVIR